MLRNSSSAGVALFMVLILTTLMYLLVSTLLLVTMTEIHLADFEQRATQALYAAESSVALGISRLRTNSLYRSETSEILPVGKNIGMVTVKFYDGTNDGNGYYRSALDPSRYRLILQGVGSVPGAQSMAKRTIEREVLIKPFAIFARNSLRVRGGCTIRGNIHANGAVTLEAGTTITGDVTSSTAV
ncbi:hypothetical protein GF339_11230, partial [candidate division KSB3 bacterium]|nr:hypothetical protein [candidate division KSB3 bacterium]